MNLDCFDCGGTIDAGDLAGLGDAFLAHARQHHDWPFPDGAIRNYAEATQRLTGPSERLDSIGAITVEPVTEARIDDWLAFFDHEAFVGKPEWAACYCLEPHVTEPAALDDREEAPHWRANRDAMVARLRRGEAQGYLAYVDGHAAGWVNASKRSDYALYREGPAADPADADVIGVSCFVIAPPYRRHGVAAALLDRVLDDAAASGAAWVEAYPFNETRSDDAGNFRGMRSMYDERGFRPITTGPRHTVVRRAIAGRPGM